MAVRFITVVRKARFVYSPFTGEEMGGFGQLLADTIRARIQSGRNVYDEPAAPLKPGRVGHPGYPDLKESRGLQPIRDWTWSGHTMRCLKVLSVNENRAVIGFLDEAMPGRSQTASQIAFWNNQIEHMWGVSNADRAVVIPVMMNYRPLVQVVGESTPQSAFGQKYFSAYRQAEFKQYMSGAA